MGARSREIVEERFNLRTNVAELVWLYALDAS